MADDPVSRADDHAPIMDPEEFFSHSTSAALWGFWLPQRLEQEQRVHVAVKEGRRAPRNRGLIGHTLIDRPGLVTLRHGRRMSGLFETWCPLGTMLSLDDLVAAGDWIVRKEVAEPDRRLDRLVALANDQNRPYHVRLGRAAQLVRCGARSRPETHLRLLLVGNGIREPEINGDIHDGAHWIAECDLVFRRERVIVEYEGDSHREKKQFRKDIDRYELLQSLGWRVVRVHAGELYGEPWKTVAPVRIALASAPGCEGGIARALDTFTCEEQAEPVTTTNIFVNIPTTDLERAKAFYTALGYSINPNFTDDNAACVVLADTIYFMVLKRDYLATFTDKPIIDPRTHAQVGISLSLESREEVDAMAEKGLAAGGTEPRPSQDYGFMYSRDIDDPDGNNLGFLYMAPEAAEKGPEAYMAEQASGSAA